MPSRAASPRFRDCRRLIIPADLIRSISSCGSTSPAILRQARKLTGGKPKPEVVYRKAEDALLTLAGEWKQKFDQVISSAPGQDRTPPVMIVVCDNTDIAEHFYRAISGEELIEADVPDDG